MTKDSKGKKIAFYTLGCKLNFSETSTIARDFLQNGYEKVAPNEQADIYIINTCSVTSMADKKCRQAITKFRNSSPDAFIAVTGCYAQLQPNKISLIPGVDLVVGTKDKFKLYDYFEKFRTGETTNIHSCEIEEVEQFESAFSIGDRTRSFLKVQDGCDYKCSYCTIPLARGKSRNDSIAHVIEQARKIVAGGIKEIVLTGVNVGDFGKTTGEKFIQLIKKLDNVEGLQRIRISSIEPNLLTDEVIEFTAHSRCFLPHFHIPLQNGNNQVLSAMRRRYKREVFSERVAKVKSVLPDAFIGVDVIVGFPGETDELFEDAYQFIDSMDVSYLHVFPYSERPDTDSIKIGAKVKSSSITSRSVRLTQLSEIKHNQFYQQFVGQVRPVLFERRVSGNLMDGFTDNYIAVRAAYNASAINQICPVKLLNFNNNIVDSELIERFEA
jgi:threonylcarbamoyladenosine tRNA methylthiotransferase MtaB